MTPAHTFIRVQTGSDGVITLVFDRPDSSANIFDEPTLIELEEHIRKLESMPGVKGLIISSAKKSIFIAGADLRSLIKKSADRSLGKFIERGQAAFNRIARLPFPTVAAIHGAAAGGGFELALTCDYRLASAAPSTRIGLPEVSLGLLPAWGGATRLPRLIGLEKASSVILEGKLYTATQAHELGLVDEITPEDSLNSKALEKIALGKPSRSAAKKSAVPPPPFLKTVPPKYPAAARAWKVMRQGLSGSIAASLKMEKKAIVYLAKTETCRNLVRNFFLAERARKLTSAAKSAKRIELVGVVGAGVMGTGIAYWLASRGLRVLVHDPAPEALKRSLNSIREFSEGAARRGLVTESDSRAAIERVTAHTDLSSFHSCDAIIEAATEKLDIKKTIFASLDKIARHDTLLATNTSALSIAQIATALSTPERLLGLHFFNPAHRMKLVEVIATAQTDTQQLQSALQLIGQIGKTAVVAADSPGFIVNRVLFPYLLEAIVLLESGIASSSIDSAALAFGFPMGPLRLLDEIGLDVSRDIAQTLAGHFPSRIAVPASLNYLVASGQLGRKKGAGYYLYNDPKPVPNPALSLAKPAGRAPDYADTTLRLLAPLLNESVRCLEEKVAAAPHDIDLAMLLGTGFPAHHGGPMRYLDYCGAAKMVGRMNKLAASVHPRFEPCDLLKLKAKNKESFYDELV